MYTIYSVVDRQQSRKHQIEPSIEPILKHRRIASLRSELDASLRYHANNKHSNKHWTCGASQLVRTKLGWVQRIQSTL